jgi:hypothetical protein
MLDAISLVARKCVIALASLLWILLSFPIQVLEGLFRGSRSSLPISFVFPFDLLYFSCVLIPLVSKRGGVDHDAVVSRRYAKAHLYHHTDNHHTQSPSPVVLSFFTQYFSQFIEVSFPLYFSSHLSSLVL